MKNNRSNSKFALFITTLSILYFTVVIVISWDERKLFDIGHDALDKMNSEQIIEAEKILDKGDKIYKRTKFLSNFSFSNGGCYNYINSSNTVKGRIALKNNDIELAKSCLLKSTEIKSTPTLSSFGPNMSLALDLLSINESEVVLAYLDACKSFWEHDRGQIEQWKKEIQNGQIPEFKGNLLY
ncbi:MAG: hypothetical protein P1U56_18235 [Saprospiraceae bacterium]|nr:hypothetical protein [Saprospiraceae bacterium]